MSVETEKSVAGGGGHSPHPTGTCPAAGSGPLVICAVVVMLCEGGAVQSRVSAKVRYVSSQLQSPAATPPDVPQPCSPSQGTNKSKPASLWESGWRGGSRAGNLQPAAVDVD